MDGLLKFLKKSDAFMMRLINCAIAIWQGIQRGFNWFFSNERWRLHRTIVRTIRTGLIYFFRVLATAWLLQLAVNWTIADGFMGYNAAMSIVFVFELVHWCRSYLGWPIKKMVGLAVNPNWIKEPPKPPKMETAYVRPKWRDTLHEQLVKTLSPTEIYYRVTEQGQTNALLEVMNCASATPDQVQRIMAVVQRHAGNLFYSDGVLVQVAVFRPKDETELKEFLNHAEQL